MTAQLGPAAAESRIRGIESITDAALSRLDDEAFLTVLLERAREILRADTAAVLLLDDQAGYLVATAAAGLEEEVRQSVRIPVGRGFAGRIAAEHRPVIIDRVDHTKVLNPILLDKGIRSLMGVPLMAGGKVIGVMHVGSLSPRAFCDEDLQLLQLAAERAAAAVQSLMSQADRVAVAALQRSLIPSALPEIAGVQLAGRYIPGRGVVGGDWYDVFTLPTGQVGLTIGDVAGSGLPAAVVMGRMRSALRAYALETPDPDDVLTRLDRKMQYFEPEALATVLYAVIDPALDQAQISLAGHFPPVIASPGMAAQLAELPSDVMIGAELGAPRQATTLKIPPGRLLCFFTDGLVERREDPIDDGLARLCHAVTTGPPEEVCASVMRAMIGSDSARDDVALLVLRRD